MNKFIVNETNGTITGITNSGKKFTFDLMFLEEVQKYNWSTTKGYYQSWINNEHVGLNKFIAQLLGLKGDIVGFRSKDKSDCTLANLTFNATKQDLAANISKSKNKRSSKYLGVSYHKGHELYQAEVKKDGIRYRLGYFENEIEAGKAYDKKKLELYAGTNKKITLNFPNESIKSAA